MFVFVLIGGRGRKGVKNYKVLHGIVKAHTPQLHHNLSDE